MIRKRIKKLEKKLELNQKEHYFPKKNYFQHLILCQIFRVTILFFEETKKKCKILSLYLQWKSLHKIIK